jgi:Zn-finger nucleic acid-binding protein
MNKLNWLRCQEKFIKKIDLSPSLDPQLPDRHCTNLDASALAATDALRITPGWANIPAMPAETLNCPMCGAAASSDSPRCEHCGARLATVACPSCFGMMFVGAKFCSHCGAKADRTEVASGPHEFCPRCKVEMEAVLIGKTHLEECPQCEGIWADADSVRQICADQEQQAAVLGVPTSHAAQSVAIEQHIHYIPCPVCKDLMNRVNFAHCSGVIVNVCNRHGTWFDKDELQRIVEFIRAGGLEKERTQQIAELEEQERRTRATSAASALSPLNSPMEWGSGDRHLGISAVANIIQTMLGG